MAVGTQQRSSSHFQKAVEIVHSGKLGKVFWVQTWNFENISPTGMGRYPDGEAPLARRLRPLARPRAPATVQPQPLPPAVPLVLRLRRRHDERLGRPPQRHRPLGARREGAAERSTRPAAIFTRDDDRDTPDTLQVVYEFPGMHPDLLDAQGERPEVQRPRLRHPVLRHRRQPAARPRRASRSSPTRWSCPTASSSSTATGRSARSTSKPAKAKGVDGQDAARPQLPRLPQASRAADRPTSRSAHRSTNTCHLGNIAYKLGRKLNWDVETETFKNDPEAKRLSPRAAQGLRAARRLTTLRAGDALRHGVVGRRGPRPPASSLSIYRD